MVLFQLTALGILIVYLLHWYFQEDNPGLFLMKFITISFASWIVEETSIRFYHFYQYSPDWNLFIGHVPILVILIWPLIIHSGWEMGSQLGNGDKVYHQLFASLIILIDASFIEIMSVKAGLWSWNSTGFFGVPFIGIFGWGYFAFLSVFVLRLKRERKAWIGKILLILIFMVFGTHVLIVATWWLIFRWILFPVNPAYIITLSLPLSLLLTHFIYRKNLGVNVDSKIMMIRIPPALLFLILYLKSSPDAFLIAYIWVISLPYLFLLFKICRRKVKIADKALKS